MSSTYIIGDVHGNYNGLVESLQKMGWKENEDRLIFVGDLVDRGIANKKVVDFVAEHKDTVHVVLGNHERQHKKMVQYYRILAKNPTVRKLAAGIFLRFTERERIIRAYDEISALRCDEKERKEFLNTAPKTFLDYQKHFIVYTMAWEDDSLWKLMLYLLDEMCGAPYDAQHTIYEYLTGSNKTRERFEAVFSNTAAEFVINTTDALARYQSVRITHNNPFGGVHSYDGDEMLTEHKNTLYVFGHVPHDKIIRIDREHSGCTYLDIDLSPDKVGIVRLEDILDIL